MKHDTALKNNKKRKGLTALAVFLSLICFNVSAPVSASIKKERVVTELIRPEFSSLISTYPFYQTPVGFSEYNVHTLLKPESASIFSDVYRLHVSVQLIQAEKTICSFSAPPKFVQHKTLPPDGKKDSDFSFLTALG